MIIGAPVLAGRQPLVFHIEGSVFAGFPVIDLKFYAGAITADALYGYIPVAATLVIVNRNVVIGSNQVSTFNLNIAAGYLVRPIPRKRGW